MKKATWILTLFFLLSITGISIHPAYSAFPTDKTEAVDGVTVIIADHINNIEDKVGITGSEDVNSLDYQVNNHKARHENAGADELDLTGLSGLLGDPQTPLAHKISHQDAGSDELDLTGLSGVLATKQDADKIQAHSVDESAIGDDRILVYKVAGDKFIYEPKGTPSAHKLSHQDGGGDEIDVTDLSGLLADGQTPLAHKISHQDAGSDELDLTGLSGVLATKQDADHIQSHSVDETDIADDKVLVYKTSGDKFVYETKGSPGAHAASHQDGGGDELDLTGLVGSGAPAGAIIAYGGASAPTGYLMCDGASYLRASYAALFAVIGTTFGSEDGDHFNVPDLRQRFPLGKAASGTGSTLGGTGGAVDHTHTGPSHTHSVPRDGWGNTQSGVAGRLITDDAGEPTKYGALNDNTSGSGGTGATGTNNAPFQVVNYIIRY